jgi:hypothetical protein
MAVERILVLHSLRDSESQRRVHQMANSPRLSAYQLDHYYIMEDLAWGVDYYLDTMADELGKKIEDFHPDIVVVHIGTVYHSAPRRYLRAINELVRAYPSTRFAADKDTLDQEEFQGLRPGDDPEVDHVVFELDGL